MASYLERMKSRTKVKKRTILLTVILLILSAGILFFQLTSTGYRMTVPYRNFTELQKNVYLANDYSGDRQELVSILAASSKRVSAFWGKLESSPTIIICDNEKTLKKLGGDRDTTTLIFLKAYSYISISRQYLNVDIMAHEMTHAELHARLYAGKLPQTLVPTWFDEGLATQNDDRAKYNEDAWNAATNKGLAPIDLSDFDTPSEFYRGEAADREYRYILSRHEVKAWIERNGMDHLFELIAEVNRGADFNALYFKAGT